MVLWVVLEVFMVKDLEVFKGFAVKSFPKTSVFFFGHNLAYISLNWMILVGYGA